MQESNFNDIRRNFIVASILMIFFLIYGTEIKIEQLLIFRFDIKGDWAIISPYWDIFIILLFFFLYTLLRYCIYGMDKINESQYKRLRLLELLKNISNEGDSKKLKAKIKSFSHDKGRGNYIDKKIIEEQDLDKDARVNLKFEITDNNTHYFGFFVSFGTVQLYGERFAIPLNGNDITILKNGFEFYPIKLTFKEKNIWNEYGASFLELFLKKEFSDFWWPLLLITPIATIILLKLLKFIFTSIVLFS